MNPARWDVEAVHRVIDGDSLRITRSRTVLLDDLELTVRDAGPTGALVRLAWLDTPERGQPGYLTARDDLAAWVDTAPGPLTVWCFDGGAGWDRVLGDLQDANGASASQFLMQVKGWAAYGVAS